MSLENNESTLLKNFANNSTIGIYKVTIGKDTYNNNKMMFLLKDNNKYMKTINGQVINNEFEKFIKAYKN